MTGPAVAQPQAGRSPGQQLAGIIPDYLRGKPKMFFGYEADFLGLAGLTAQTVTVQIQADSDFYLAQLQAAGTATATPQTELTFLPFTLQIQDSGSGRSLLSAATHLENLRGTGQLPGILPWGMLVRAASALSLTLTNLSGVQSDVRLLLSGFKIFSFPQAGSSV